METEDECNVHNFDRHLVLVEYPGVVENEDRAIKTMGGLHNISTTYSLRNRRLELRFRPDDAFSKPACGDRHKTLSLLLKVKVRHRKNKNDQPSGESSAEDSDSSPGTYSTENSSRMTCSIAVVGRIETAYRFRNLCDFQYIPITPEIGSNGSAVCEYSTLVPTGLPKASWLTGEAQYFLPPATFSRMDTMQQYLYRKEPGDDSASPPNIIGRTRRRRSGHAVFVTFDIADIPKKPRAIAMKLLRLKFLDGIHLETVKKFFGERPIWSKNALMYVTKYTKGQLKYLLPAIAYYYVTGPWRVMWVRFGYDPRLDAAALKYQTLDYRLRTIGGLKMKVKPKRSYCNHLLPYKSSPASRPKTTVITKENLQPEKIEEKQCEDIANNDNIYVFHPGMVPPSRQMFYQYCDIDVPEIQEMLEKLPVTAPGAKCHERLGWMPSGMDDRCREIINKLVTEVLKQENMFIPSIETEKQSRDQEKDSDEDCDYEDDDLEGDDSD